MHCKFLDHGLAIAYNGVIKPCCEWSHDQNYAKLNHYTQIDLATWHNSAPIVDARRRLHNNEWPISCQRCEQFEKQGRFDSTRGNAASAYESYQDNDITLEIRPGSVCNFACQTCWPEASSRVAQFHERAGLIDIKNLNSSAIDDFDFLLPIASRIKNIVLLGGEPFYDKNCLKFLQWAIHNLTANITMFTNGSAVDWTWVDNYTGTITMVFSIDAVGKPAEYIRFGTDWSVVENNFQQAMIHPKVETRVNITTSVYNYYHIPDVIDLLINNWPTVVSFGSPRSAYLLETTIPIQFRDTLVARLQTTIDQLKNSNIENGQKSNAINALQSIINNLISQPWDQKEYNKLCDFVIKMDQVKKIDVDDYVDFLTSMLSKQTV
jgi:MoaA/NifB/PqqE/SkfB family radical SAM enzyme